MKSMWRADIANGGIRVPQQFLVTREIGNVPIHLREVLAPRKVGVADRRKARRRLGGEHRQMPGTNGATPDNREFQWQLQMSSMCVAKSA
jgi:hypothetical protein